MSAKNKEWRHPVKQWVILDMFSAFRDDHIWTYEQAVLSVMIDMDRKRKGTIRGYASLWNWGKTKVGDLLPQIKDDAKAELKPFAKKEEKEAKNTKNERTTSGQRADNARTTSGQRADNARTTSGQRADKTEAQSRIEYDLNADFENGGGQEADNARTTRGQEADNARTHTNHTSIPHKSPPQELANFETEKQPTKSNPPEHLRVVVPHPNVQMLSKFCGVELEPNAKQAVVQLPADALQSAISFWRDSRYSPKNVWGIIDKGQKIAKTQSNPKVPVLGAGETPYKPYKPSPNPAKPKPLPKNNPIAQMATAMATTARNKTNTSGWINPYEGKTVEERVAIFKQRNDEAEFEKWGMVGLDRKQMMQMVELMDEAPKTQKMYRGLRRAI